MGLGLTGRGPCMGWCMGGAWHGAWVHGVVEVVAVDDCMCILPEFVVLDLRGWERSYW